MVYRKPILPEQRALVPFLNHENSYSQRKIASIVKISKSSVFDIIKKANDRSKRIVNERKSKGGRPRLLSERDRRRLKRAVKKLRQSDPNFSVMEIVKASGINMKCASYRTFLRYIRTLGYGYYNSRRKGVLTAKDLKKRKKFAREALKKEDDYWTKEIAFYLDGVSFVYKGNPLSDVIKPKGRIWRKRSEGLQLSTKGSKELAGGKRLHLLVAISYGHGVICAEPYEKMSGAYFARFIRRKFPNLFEIAGIGEKDSLVFLMDNDPSQTSAKAKRALRSARANMHVIPARSPDLNPIENLFNMARKQINAEVKEKNISNETWTDFVSRVTRNIWSVPKDYIDKTIASMPVRVKNVIKNKGYRTKY